MSAELWARAITERARAHWTAERTAAVTRGKDLPILPAEAPTLLRALGLLRRDATMPGELQRKYLQLNHMIRLLGPPLRELRQRFDRLTVVDAGCGLSYLTLALAWCFEHVWDAPARVVGVDRRGPLIDECQRRTALVGLEHVLSFRTCALEDFEPEGPVHVVLGLHACDTATDDALGLALAHDAELVAVAPCCQAELARGWAALTGAGPFGPLWQTPHLRREAAATLTDALRMLLLAGAGYEARAIEFVASEHTPKNTLIRGMRRGGPDLAALREYAALKAATGGVGIKLEALLPAAVRAALAEVAPGSASEPGGATG